jgi:hypothetical protein
MSKGSSPRPFAVDQKTFDKNWDNIFKKKSSNIKFGEDSLIRKSDYQDILSTEDCMLDALDNYPK